jgi:excisionase family DNA binding protein
MPEAAKLPPLVRRSDGTDLTPLAHSVENAASRIGIGRTKTWELIKRGELRTIQIDGRRLVPEVSCVEFVARKLADAELVAS